MARALRIVFLLLVLATVAEEAWLARARTTSWKDTVLVALYPINGDGSAVTAAYVSSLSAEQFKEIERYAATEAARYGLPLSRPIEVVVAPPRDSRPPPPPVRPNALQAVIWSLQMRWWASRNDTIGGPRPNVRLFLSYYDPAARRSLPHSVGLERGLIGVVNVFAHEDMAPQNDVVIAHELLHTFGATDKYDPATNQPRFPDGYAEPGRGLPQSKAELMAGRTPLSTTEAEIPESLAQTVIGPSTAAEIRWSGT